MNDNLVVNYGWSSPQSAHSCGYLAPSVLEIIEKLDVKRIMDLGAGNGALCSTLAAAGYEVVGVENDKQGVEIARSVYSDIPFYNYGVQDNPAELLAHERPFDVVVSTEVVEHLFSPHLLPIYARQVLKEGGYLIVTTPYHGYLKNLALSIFGHWDNHFSSLWHGGHIKFWSRTTLTQLLHENGFQVVAFSGVGRCHYLWKSMVIVAQRA